MSKKYKVGDVFYHVESKQWLKAVKHDECSKCVFYEKDCHAETTPACTKTDDICFIKTAKPVNKPNSAVSKKPLHQVDSVRVNVKTPTLKMKSETFVAYCKETSWGVNPSIVDKVNPLREKNPIMSNNPNQTYSFEIKLNNGLRFVAPRVTLSTVAPDCKITAAILPSTERFIVCLIENGKLAPSTEPKQHNTRESADKEALRLCKLHHQEFVVLQVVSSIKPQEPKKEVFA